MGNIISWALNEEPIAIVKGPGVIDVTVWQQSQSMTVHLVNLTNPMMMKGPFRELIPVDAEAVVSIPQNKKLAGVHLLISGRKAVYEMKNEKVYIKVPQIMDHEILAMDYDS